MRSYWRQRVEKRKKAKMKSEMEKKRGGWPVADGRWPMAGD
jgi:hypothetical protein